MKIPETTYTSAEIATYIDKKIDLTPNSHWTIYEGLNGLTHTSGSMEYRDADHRKVMSFMTMDEAPGNIKAIIDSVEFQQEN